MVCQLLFIAFPMVMLLPDIYFHIKGFYLNTAIICCQAGQRQRSLSQQKMNVNNAVVSTN